MIRRFVSAGVWASWAVLVPLWCLWLGVVFVCTVPFDRGRYTVGRWFRRCAVTAAGLNPFWTFRVSGVSISDPRRPYVAVANHESIADNFLISHLPWEMKWLSKEVIFRIPFMGWMMRMAGDIAVRRNSRHSRAEAIEECRGRLKRRVSVMIFPEGTRSGTGDLLPFKDGAFRVAIETGCPILPLAVAGTRNAIPKGSWVFGRAHAEVRVLQPIPTDGLSLEDLPMLRDRVRTLIDETRQALFRELEIQPTSAALPS